jgi:hypothetical protein
MAKKQDLLTDFREPEWIFPYLTMEVGDSFFMPTVRPAYGHYIIDVTSKRVDVVMKTHTVIEDNVLGVRAWRVS